jgi:hypothetical protein
MIVLLAAALLQVRVGGDHLDVFGEKEAAGKASAEAEAAAARFVEIFGAAPPRGAIVLTKDGKPAKDKQKDLAYAKHGARWIWRWEAKKGLEPDETMTHELGHLFLIFWLHGETPPGPQYGSRLPDWLDEGVANVLEGPNAHAAYDGEMRKRVAARTHMPLTDLFACLHPQSRETSDRKKAEDRWLFYAQSWSVTAFLIDRGGIAAFRAIVSALKDGKKLETVLGTKGLPNTVADLEAAWMAWAAEERKKRTER